MRVLFKDSPYHGQRQFQKPAWIYPAHLAAYATNLRNQGDEVSWLGKDDGSFDKVIESDLDIDVDFENLPFPDRVFTNAKAPKYLSYGNYKKKPATHYLSSNLCWWAGKKGCVFCVDSERIINGEKRGVRAVDHVMTEIENCASLGFKEMFDDAGTIPINAWLEDLCNAMIKTGLNKRMMLGCNLKPIKQNFKLMKKAGFRFILVGLESANQKTIDRIQKGQRADKVIENFKAMSDAGLEPHATSMLGYEWETHEDAMRTVDLIYFLLRKGYIKTAQASVFMPPRTAPPKDHPAQKYVQKIYDVYKKPWYWWKKITDVRCLEDVTYLLKRLNHVKHAE